MLPIELLIGKAGWFAGGVRFHTLASKGSVGQMGTYTLVHQLMFLFFDWIQEQRRKPTRQGAVMGKRGSRQGQRKQACLSLLSGNEATASTATLVYITRVLSRSSTVFFGIVCGTFAAVSIMVAG